ncbi:MAG: hypothetical protein GU352_02605 [Acidilobus sp.]|jgi:hypothetical protein|nr:hypothetical protein [Acidilobus sp.]
MNRIGKLALVAGILAIALAVPIAAANVIYLYQATVNMPSALPVYFKPGPDASEVNLQLQNITNGKVGTPGTIVTLTVPVTNATEIYVYHALELVVNSPPSYLTTPLTLYVNYCSYSGNTAFNNITLVIYPTSGTPSFAPGNIIELTPSSTGCSATYTVPVTLTPGTTYYVDFAIFPSKAAPVGSTATLTILFGFSYGSSAPNTYGSIP